MSDPWAEFLAPVQTAPANDPWAAFTPSRPALSPGPDALVAPMGSDGVSGDEIRARNAGNTRAQMRPDDISSAYDEAQRQGNVAERLAMAEAYVRREKADSPVSMAVGDSVRQFAKGVPVLGGLADEANALTSAATSYVGSLGGKSFGPEYEKGLDYQRARDQVFEGDNPGTSLALQLGGGFASGVGAAAKVAPKVANWTRPALLGTGVVGGATLGAADGFTRGEGLDGRASGAMFGAGVGGLVGGLAPVLAKGVTSGAQSIADRFTTNRQVAKMGLDRGSADMLMRTLAGDDTLGARGAANIARGGDSAMLADAGPNAAGLLDTIIQRGGQGSSLAMREINERASNAGGQVDDALNTYLGRPRESAARDLVVYGDKTNPLSLIYKRAYDTPIDYTSAGGRQIEELVKSRVPATAIAKANNLMRVEGEQSRQILAKIADDGTVTFEQLPDVRQLDYITRALNDVAKAGDGQGALGGNTAEGRAYKNLSRDIRSTLRELVPDYGKALDRASDEIGKVDALKFGGGLLSRAVTRDEVVDEVAGMSAAQLGKMRQGVRDHVDEVVANVRKTLTDPNIDARQATQTLRNLSSDAAREKLSLVIGPQEAKGLLGRLDEASRAFELKAATANNSKTFARTTSKEVIDEMTAPGPIGLLTQGKPLQATRGVVQGLLGTDPASVTARQDGIYNNLASALTGPRGAEAQRFAEQLAEAYGKRQGNAALAGTLGGRISGAGAGLLHQGLMQLGPRVDGRANPPRR